MNDIVNYIWVGPPRTFDLSLLKQDLIGPLNMHAAINHSITHLRFWCLNEYVEYYQFMLDDTHIAVSSIDSFLREKLEQAEISSYAEKTLALVERVMYEKYHVRACVSAKEAFAFFLMAVEGGYVLDTNVLPASDSIEFSGHAKFSMPAYQMPVLIRDNDEHADVGMMYSPPNDNAHATRALGFFLEKIHEIDSRFSKSDKYSERYKSEVLHVVIQAALLADEDINQPEIEFWPAKRLSPGFPILLEQQSQQPHLVKYYMNSHQANREEIPILHSSIEAFYANERVTHYLQEQAHSGSPHQVFTVGDILIKIDCRARKTKGFNTKHHAMLVIGVENTGHPRVAHMKFTDFSKHTGSLVIEACPAYKDLILIHCPTFSFKLRQKIASLANQARRNSQLRIDSIFLEEQNKSVNLYRGKNQFESIQKVNDLRRECVKATEVLLDVEQLVSCHDFVLSTIHLACKALGEPIPQGLNLPPQLAWPDILHTAARQDPMLQLCHIQKLTKEKYTGFFTEAENMQNAAPRKEACCPIM